MFIVASWWVTLLNGYLDEVRSKNHVPPDPSMDRLHPCLYLDSVPPWFQGGDGPPANVRSPIRPVSYADPAELPEWIAYLPDLPTVYLSLGTVYNRRPDVFATILDALADEPINVLCTVGPDNDECIRPGMHPGNAYVAAWLPQGKILPRCDAVVCHGGYNTVLGALMAGLPVLSVPFDSDQPHNAHRCAELGAGLVVEECDLSAERVRDGVRRLLGDPSYGQRTRTLRGMIDRMPDLRSAASALHELGTWRD
jgi:MGT family glycosyltransferase